MNERHARVAMVAWSASVYMHVICGLLPMLSLLQEALSGCGSS